MHNFFTSGSRNIGFSIATAICISITSTSRRKRRRFSTASSSTIASVSSTSRTISPFSRWILISKRGHKLGALFLRRAAEALRDPGLLEVADFYKCYRAFVRGEVESLGERMKSRTHATCGRYFQLALRYATVGSAPLVLVVMGRIASGKSTIARQLARELDWPVFSSRRDSQNTHRYSPNESDCTPSYAARFIPRR